VHSGAGLRMTPETQYGLVLDRELRLTNVVNPQLTFWVRGRLDSDSHFRTQISADGGLSWG
jgi:hypothetical protein